MAAFTYSFKTTPYPHQAQIFRESVLKEGVAILADPGTGKSKIIIDKASFLFQVGKIDALMVVAPNGVQRAWGTDEIPIHMPDVVFEQTQIFVYQSAKAKTKKSQALQKQLLEHKGLAVLLVSYEASITAGFKLFAKKFLTKRKAMMVLDESHRIKSATSKVKTTLVAMGGYAKYRRILTGTPIELPPDIYSQLRFVNPLYWKERGFDTKAEFDAKFCVTQDRQFGQRQFKQVVGYRNLDLLAEYVKESGYRLTMEDVGIHLPPTVYSNRYYSMTAEQTRVYNEFKEEMKTVLCSGDLLETDVAITKLLRLQQIVCGYVSTEAEQPVQFINPDGKNPRLECAMDILGDLTTQGIVFCRFRKDIDQLMERLGDKAVRYDGQLDSDEKARSKKKFQDQRVQFFVASEAGAEGLTLVGSKSMIFYSNTFSMLKRTQKEARQRRIGQADITHVIDIVCEGTVDEHIIKALRDKKEIADLISGKGMKDFL
jgi:SNF2 family DNA or RNA helicase